MAKQIFKPSDLNKRVAFTTIETGYNENNGNPEEVVKTLFTKWGAPKRRTLNQQYNIQGTDLQDTIVIGVRHDERILKSLGVNYKGVNYDIKDISPDDSNNVIRYDLLTIKKVGA